MADLPRSSRRMILSEDELAVQWVPPSDEGDGISDAMAPVEDDVPEGALDQDQQAALGEELEAADMPSAVMPTAAQLEEITSQAHAEGYEVGHKEGFEYGHNEGLEEGRKAVQERVNRLDEILSVLDQPFLKLDQQVEQEVITLVIAMVRQLVRREIKADPQQIVGVVREALGVLPVNARRIRVLLHPEDAELVREAYTLGDSDQKWQIIEDPVIARGGCRVYTENSQIDATLESRLNALIAPLLSNDRGGDAESADAEAEAQDVEAAPASLAADMGGSEPVSTEQVVTDEVVSDAGIEP